MRISFDLDDTLRMHGEGYDLDPNKVPLLLRSLFKERFRKGTYKLLHQLQNSSHELCLYTTSSRSESYIKWWFFFYGIKLTLIINDKRHAKAVKPQGMERAPSKNPAKFGIDLHIDDLPGVAIEGQRHGFDVLILDPDDPSWTDKVISAVALKEQS